MRHAPVKLACLTAVAGMAVVAAGCGKDVPANSVAKVGDSTISKDEFNRWLKTAVSSQAGGGAQNVAVPDPPEFTRCAAARAKQPVPKGSKRPGADALKKQCKREYDELKSQVMQFLIQAEWIQQEAESQDVRVSNAEVKRSFEDRKKQEFPNDKAYQRFLRTSGMSEQDILFRVKLDVLQQKLTQKVTEKAGKVTDEDVEEYYEKNKKRFAQPERRSLNVVLTKNESRANAAKKQLEDGASWKSVAKRFSIDEASKSQGGKLPGVAKGQQEKALDAAVFRGKKGRLTGPVKTLLGYYVFELSKIAKASQQTPEQAKPTIKQLVISERRQKALDEFTKKLREKWRQRTKCQDGFVTQGCSNGPKPAATPAAHRPEPEPGAAAAIDELAPGMSASRATVAQLAAPPERGLACAFPGTLIVGLPNPHGSLILRSRAAKRVRARAGRRGGATGGPQRP
jgi:foldase protein PrsA